MYITLPDKEIIDIFPLFFLLTHLKITSMTASKPILLLGKIGVYKTPSATVYSNIVNNRAKTLKNINTFAYTEISLERCVTARIPRVFNP